MSESLLVEQMECNGDAVLVKETLQALHSNDPHSPNNYLYVVYLPQLLSELQQWMPATLPVLPTTLNKSILSELLTQLSYPVPDASCEATAELTNIITFLLGHVQCCRILNQRDFKLGAGDKETKMDTSTEDMDIAQSTAEDENMLAFLNTCQSDLVMDIADFVHVTPNVNDGALVLQSTIQPVATLLSQNPRPDVMVSASEFSDAQLGVLNEINAMLRNDFALRRSMLLQRIDVSISSILRKDEAQANHDKIMHFVKTIVPQNEISHQIHEVFHVSRGFVMSLLTNKEADRTSGRSRVKTWLNKTVRIPDRGGRAFMPKDAMPALKSHAEGLKVVSDRKGGGRGGKGGGGGGNRKNNKRQNNKGKSHRGNNKKHKKNQ